MTRRITRHRRSAAGDRRWRGALALGVIAFFLGVTAAPVRSATLSSQEEAGRAIFQNGESSFGDVFSARLGVARQEVPGAVVRCANCHGADGLGRPEAGVHPSNITWSELTKAYGHVHENGRRHPAFDEDLLKRAITEGVDPAGNALDGAMPRFNITERDFKALVAYLKRLERLRDPGIGADSLRIGTLVPTAGRFGELGRAVKGILQAYFDRINAGGGIYGRKLVLVAVEFTEDRDIARRQLRSLMREKNVFALLAPFAAGLEEDLARLANDEKIPVLGPITLYGDDPRVINEYVFHLLSGVGELAEVLAAQLAAEPKVKTQSAVLLYPNNASGVAVADSVEEQLTNRGWRKLSRLGFQPGAFDAGAAARTLKARGAGIVFVLGPGADVRALASEAVKSGPAPRLLVPGPLAPRAILDLPAAYAGRVLLAYPTLPTDQKPEALRAYAALFRDGRLARGHQTLQVPAYSSAVLLTEALKRIGRDLTRAKLVATLESLHGFDPGLVPAVSFNSKRRIGALGGYAVAVDIKGKTFRPLGGFVALP